MRSRKRPWFRPPAVFPVLTLVASAAWAQPRPKVQLSSYEVLIAVSPGWTSQDVNAIPECLRLSLPCTRGSPGRAGGVGVAVSMSRYLRKPADAHQAGALAITVDVSRFSSAYDSSDGGGAIRRARMHATSVLVGPRITTSFLYEDRRSPRAGRYFFHALVGGQRSNVAGPRPAFVLGGGGEMVFPRGNSRRDLSGPPRAVTLRVGLDYWLRPGRLDAPGFRLVVGVLIGPRLTRS